MLFRSHLFDPDESRFQGAICRGESWLATLPVLKDLSTLVGRPGAIIIDDSPWAAVCNPGNAIIIPPFDPRHPDTVHDTTLLYVMQVVYRAYSMRSFAMDGPTASKGAGFPYVPRTKEPVKTTSLLPLFLLCLLCLLCLHPSLCIFLCLIPSLCLFHVPILAPETPIGATPMDLSFFVKEHPFVVEASVPNWMKMSSSRCAELCNSHTSHCLKLDVADASAVFVRVAGFKEFATKHLVTSPPGVWKTNVLDAGSASYRVVKFNIVGPQEVRQYVQ